MKSLEINQMEKFTGGDISCSGGAGAAVAITAGLTFLTIASGGTVGLALGAIAAFGFGGGAAMGNCVDQNFQ